MSRLLPTITLAVFFALAMSLLTSWLMQEYPPFRANFDPLEKSITAAAVKTRNLLNDQPESAWDNLLSETRLDDRFDIYWYSIEDYYIPIEDNAELQIEQQLISFDNDDTPIAELLFPTQKMVLIITPLQSHHKLLNRVALVIAILGICLVAAALVFFPIAKRLKYLQSLAGHYAEGRWQSKYSDKHHDEIGAVGKSMQDMADRIQHLVGNNNALVQDQRDLMQAVAHEFRAPMARMRFALEMDESDNPSPDAVAEISEALDELNDMVSEVLEYSRMQISAPALEYSSVSIDKVVVECIRKCEIIYPDTRFEFGSQSQTQIQCDPASLQRALINLISNAAKYGDSQVQVSTFLESNHLMIQVDDDGHGIPVDQRDRALKPFIRLDSSRTRKLGGTGLGLAIAHSVAMKHGGDLQIDSSPTGGARLTLEIPVDKPLH